MFLPLAIFHPLFLIFLGIVYLGVMGHISRATGISRWKVSFYVFTWMVGIFLLCYNWGQFHGFFRTLWYLFLVFIAPFVYHLAWHLLKEFVIWALKGL